MEHVSGIIQRVMKSVTVEDDRFCLYCGGHAPCIKPKCREALAAAKRRMGVEA